MQSETLKTELEKQFPDSRISVTGEGSHVEISIIGDCFLGLTSVKRQQLVYACINQYILDGSIHAVSIKAHTPAEWDDASI